MDAKITTKKGIVLKGTISKLNNKIASLIDVIIESQTIMCVDFDIFFISGCNYAAIINYKDIKKIELL